MQIAIILVSKQFHFSFNKKFKSSDFWTPWTSLTGYLAWTVAEEKQITGGTHLRLSASLITQPKIWALSG